MGGGDKGDREKLIEEGLWRGYGMLKEVERVNVLSMWWWVDVC